MTAKSVTESQAEVPGDTYVARLPILDSARKVVAYELVFRAVGPATARDPADDVVSARVISDAVTGIGLDALANGLKALVPVSRRLLLEGIPSVLPPAKAVLLLSAEIEADSDVLGACRQFRKGGYELAIDRFVLNAWTRDLVPLANYLKVEFASVDRDSRAAVAASRGANGPRLIASGVERGEIFEAAKAEGFSLFQGFFFGRPSLHESRGVPAQQLGNLRLLQALNQPAVSVSDLEDLIKRDAALAYRILRTVNSAAFAQRRTIDSIRQALIMLGRDTVRRWASLWALSSLGSGQSELVVMSTVRARCCELLTGDSPDGGAQGFLVGMCSLLDAMLGCPLEAAIGELPLPPEARAALLGEDNALRRVLDAVAACETGDWDLANAAGEHAGVGGARLGRVYVQALQWAHELHQAKPADA